MQILLWGRILVVRMVRLSSKRISHFETSKWYPLQWSKLFVWI